VWRKNGSERCRIREMSEVLRICSVKGIAEYDILVYKGD
jgi:hypothetical protein